MAAHNLENISFILILKKWNLKVCYMLTWQDCVATAECRLSLDCENVCNVVEVINLFYFIFDEGPNDDWTKELLLHFYIATVCGKIHRTVQIESGKIIAINGCQLS